MPASLIEAALFENEPGIRLLALDACMDVGIYVPPTAIATCPAEIEPVLSARRLGQASWRLAFIDANLESRVYSGDDGRQIFDGIQAINSQLAFEEQIIPIGISGESLRERYNIPINPETDIGKNKIAEWEEIRSFLHDLVSGLAA